MVNGVHRRSFVFFVIIIHQFHCDFRIRRGIKLISLAQKLVLQFLVIFDNSIMNRHNIPVVTHMGMGVCLGRLAMGSPACMSDSARSRNRLPVVCLFFQDFQSALCLDYFYILFTIADRQSGRIIAPVFQLGKAVQQDRRRLMVSCKSYYTTHITLLVYRHHLCRSC